MHIMSESKELLTSPASRHDGENGPTEDLKEVVGKGYPVEAVSIRNGAFAASLWSQGPEVQVCQEVGVFGELAKRFVSTGKGFGSG